MLRASGHDVQHVHEIGLTGASDHLVLERARAESRVLISADTDFGAILVRSQATMPSFLLLRRAANRRVIAQAAVILDNLEAVQTDLDAGACRSQRDDVANPPPSHRQRLTPASAASQSPVNLL